MTSPVMTGSTAHYRSAQNYWAGWLMLVLTTGMWVLTDPFSTRGVVVDALPLSGALAVHASLAALSLGSIGVFMRPAATLTDRRLVVRRTFSTVSIPYSRIIRWLQQGRHPVVYTDSEQRVTVRAVDVPPAASGRELEPGDLLALLDEHVAGSDETTRTEW